MANFILVLLILIGSLSGFAKTDRLHTEGYLGEKDLDSYSERYQPIIFQDLYRGKITFEDEIFFQNFFNPFLFQKEKDVSFFLRSELNAGLSCSNELLGSHFDEIRFSYRLITLSYLLEAEWHLKLLSDKFGMKNGCQFNLKSWIESCRPKSLEMRKFTERLAQYFSKYEESFPPEYTRATWWREFKEKKFKWYSHYRMESVCDGGCQENQIEAKLKKTCEKDQYLMSLICSEQDEVLGLSQHRDAYYLIGLSNIINTYNKKGEATACLRRFSEVMAYREVDYESLKNLFPSLQKFLRDRHQERFLQGRAFFYGSTKEFEAKGVADIFVKEQPLQIAKAPKELPETILEAPKKEEVVKVEKPLVVQEVKVTPHPPVVQEVRGPVKSAFLQAAEILHGEKLDKVEVDMLKLKYDYVFSLNMINILSERLKTFMALEALKEMKSFDNLGTKEGPVPLMFLKYMIDMEEHHGLWNILQILGDTFYVSNEIDATFSPKPELVQITNNETTGRQWQIYILKP